MKDNFVTLCNVEFDATEINNSLKTHKSRDSLVYYTSSYDVILIFGLTELAAQVSWRDDDVSCYLGKQPDFIAYLGPTRAGSTGVFYSTGSKPSTRLICSFGRSPAEIVYGHDVHDRKE
jgi:hypothetical protein